MRRVRYLESAARDIEVIFDYLLREAGPVVATKVTARIRKRCRELAHLPGTLGRPRPELRPDVRSMLCGTYVVFFRYQTGLVEVIHVIEGHRDIDAMFGTGDTV